MANEAVPIELPNGGRIIRFTCADGTGIPKGTICQLSSDPATVTASSADNQTFAGIACEEKVASDGQTSIGLWTEGIFDVTCTAGGATLGNYVKIGGANTVTDADDAGAQGANETVGMALETGGASEVIRVAVGIY